MVALLDVNVLIALLDAGHVHHAMATQWLADHLEGGWASCPLTQNGCIRILSQPGYPNPAPAADVAARLAEAARHPAHHFWPDAVSVLAPGLLRWDRLLSGRHITDAYLLALAVQNKGRFVTLDRGIPLAAVPGAQARHLVVLAEARTPR
ncbi:MAG: TA system VapC family ribonuclease toxin [Curvibacter sp.]|jgi:toxin-antitoxin system PIN domain toxin|nr:PIN domain-containing protein [Curvibacter sp.]